MIRIIAPHFVAGVIVSPRRWATRVEQNRNTRASKLEPHEADQIRWLRSTGQTYTDIAKFFSLSLTHTSRIARGLSRAA